MTRPERHDWLNALVGTLDIAFHLTDDEQYLVASIVRQLLDGLNIPDRGDPQVLPTAVALEAAAHIYSEQLGVGRDHGLARTVRAAQQLDVVASLATWREALLGMLLTGYPDITGVERAIALKIIAELLVGIGVPDRAAAVYPDDVIRLYQQLDAPRY